MEACAYGDPLSPQAEKENEEGIRRDRQTDTGFVPVLSGYVFYNDQEETGIFVPVLFGVEKSEWNDLRKT